MTVASTSYFPAANSAGIDIAQDVGGTGAAPTIEGLQGEDLPDSSASTLIKRNSLNTAWELISYTGSNLTSDLAGKAASSHTHAESDVTSLATDLALRAGQPGGRLTLTTLVPVTTGDVSSTSVFYTPYVSNVIQLWNGSAWVPTIFSDTALPLGTVTSGKPYDVFAYLSGGNLALESLIWSSDTARGTAVTIQDGRYCKSGDHTRLLLGTFYTTSTTTTEDSAAKRLLWNTYNRRRRPMVVTEATDTWTYTIATYRQANNSAANQLQYIDGLGETMVGCQARALVTNASSTATITGIGLDSTTVNSAQLIGLKNIAGTLTPVDAIYNGFPGVGMHTLVWLEQAQATGTSTWSGDGGTPTIMQAGIAGWMVG